MYYSFYCFNDRSYYEKQGMALTGYPFDDGGYTQMLDNILAVNAGSPNKEGAWEFISYMLGDEVQSSFYIGEDNAVWGRGVGMGSFPVSRSAFEKLCGSHLEVFNEDHHITYNDGGTDAYFSGAKTIDEVRSLIENRVQLYLNERQ